MRSQGRGLLFVASALSILDTLAQTLTLTIPNGPTVIQVFTTNANGLPIRSNIATLSGSTSPIPSPSPASSDTPSTSISHGNQSTRSGHPTAPPAPTNTKRIPAGVIAAILVVVIILLAIAFGLFFFKRRKRLRPRRLSVRVELDPIGSPVADKQFLPDPFITDVQARGLGYDVSRQPTRRIEAKFLTADQLPRASAASSDSSSYWHARQPSSPPPPPVPQILLTREGELNARPITPSSSGDHGPISHVARTAPSSTQHYTTDVKSSSSLVSTSFPTSMISSSTTLSESSTSPASQAEIAQRMRDLLAQLENHVAAPTSDSGAAVVQLQRQVEMLQRENEELRLTGGAEAPPAYYDGGRF